MWYSGWGDLIPAVTWEDHIAQNAEIFEKLFQTM